MQDPFRDFQTGGIGIPSGDVNKYYMLHHREWDYDQVMTATIDSTDSLWLYPDQAVATDIADGYDSRFLLSVGPVDLLPDSSLRAIFALLGGDFIHIDPHNRDNLLWGRYDEYYRNLHFDILRKTAQDAVAFARTMMDPLLPPTGLRVVREVADTVELAWDPRVFPDISGYNLYIKPVDDVYLMAPYVVTPGAAPADMGGHPYYIPAGRTSHIVTGLTPGRYADDAA